MFVDGGDDPDFGFLEQFLITDTKAFVSSSYWAERIIPDNGKWILDNQSDLLSTSYSISDNGNIEFSIPWHNPGAAGKISYSLNVEKLEYFSNFTPYKSKQGISSSGFCVHNDLLNDLKKGV